MPADDPPADDPPTDDPPTDESTGPGPDAAAGDAVGASAISRARRVAGRATGTGVTPTVARPEPERRSSLDTVEPDGPSAPDAQPTAPASKAGRNLPMAIGVGLGLGAVVVATLFLYRPSFAVVVGLAVIYGSWELAQAVKTANIRLSLVPVLVGGVAMLAAAWERGPSGLVVALLITVVGVFVWRIADGAHGFTRDAAASTLVVLYLPTLAGFAVLLVHPDDGAARVLAFVATVVCSDTGGYATGVLFGKHPLAPVVSKGKTWEGFAGSVLTCGVAGVLFLTLTFHEAWWKGLLFGLGIVLTATVGDLGESMIKRDLGIKDMGSLLPGHGGMMDRLDSLLPCAAVAYLLLSGLAPV